MGAAEGSTAGARHQAVIAVGPHDISVGLGHRNVHRQRFPRLDNLVARQEDPGRIRAGIRQLRAQKSVVRAVAEVPLGPSARALLGEAAPWFKLWMRPPADDNPFWES